MRVPRQLLLLLLALGLSLLAVAQIASADGEVEASSAAREPTIELSEEGELEEECLEEEDEGEEEEAGESEEVEEEECEVDAGGRLGPDDCVLRTVHVQVVAFPPRNEMRLTLGYTTSAPSRATVEYLTRRGERLGATTRSLGRSGVVRLTKHLDRGQMVRLQRSHGFTVTVNVPGVPQDCERLETQRLARRDSTDARVTWLQVG